MQWWEVECIMQHNVMFLLFSGPAWCRPCASRRAPWSWWSRGGWRCASTGAPRTRRRTTAASASRRCGMCCWSASRRSATWCTAWAAPGDTHPRWLASSASRSTTWRTLSGSTTALRCTPAPPWSTPNLIWTISDLREKRTFACPTWRSRFTSWT